MGFHVFLKKQEGMLAGLLITIAEVIWPPRDTTNTLYSKLTLLAKQTNYFSLRKC